MTSENESGVTLSGVVRPKVLDSGLKDSARKDLRKVFSFPVFLGGLLMAGVFLGVCLNLQEVSSPLAAGSRTAFEEGDTWWHIAVGEHILSKGTWPTSDPYSFTVRGNDWMAYEWLGEVVMALAARLGGLRALTALLVGLAGALLVLLYYHAYLRSGNVKAAFVACALVLPLAAAVFTPRPQLLGYVFLLITLICLERFRQGRQKTLWILPGVFLLWVNTHGTFTFGLLVTGLYWGSGLVGFRWGGLVAERWTAEQRRHLAVVFLLCLLALSLTPYGTRLAAYPLQMVLSQPNVVADISEWRPLGFGHLLGKEFLGLLLLFLLAQVLFRLTYRLEEIALLLFGVYAACVHQRFVLFFVLVFAPPLAVLLARWIHGYQPAKDRWALNATLLVLMGGGLVGFFPSNRDLERVVAQLYPRGAVDYLRQRPGIGPMLNEYKWGGYLIWSLSPEHKVFIDGRTDIYDYGGVLSDYIRIVRVEGNTLLLLRKYHIEACLLNRDAPLGTLLAALPDWERVYADELSNLFVHKEARPATDLGSGGSGRAAQGAVRGADGSFFPVQVVRQNN